VFGVPRDAIQKAAAFGPAHIFRTYLVPHGAGKINKEDKDVNTEKPWIYCM
jgi:hypothetical protein